MLFQRNNSSKKLRVIFFYILYCIAVDLISFILHKEGHKTDYIVSSLYDVFTIVEFFFFCSIYYFIISNVFIKGLISKVAAIFFVSSLIDFFLVSDKSYTAGLQSVLILVMCIYYFFEQLKKPNSFLIYDNFDFWVIISFLIYVAGTFFLYVIATNVVVDKEFKKVYVIINFSFNLLKNILLSIAMLMKEDKVASNNFSRNNFQN